MDKQREQFEAWMATQHDQGSEHVMAMVGATDDRYQSPVTSSMWSAWQAAIGTQPVRIYGCCAQPEGELHTDECPNMRHLAARQPVESKGESEAVEMLNALGYVFHQGGWQPKHPLPRQPVGQFKVVAYQQIKPSADDPEVFDAKLWALPPGHPVPEGCTPLYWWTGKDAPPAQAVDLGQFREAVTQWKLSAERVIRCKGHAMAEDKVKVRDEAVRLLALIDSQA